MPQAPGFHGSRCSVQIVGAVLSVAVKLSLQVQFSQRIHEKINVLLKEIHTNGTSVCKLTSTTFIVAMACTLVVVHVELYNGFTTKKLHLI